MRLIISSFGSVGDYEPFFALALELKKHKHHPILAFPPQMEERSKELGLEFVPVGTRDAMNAVRELLSLEISGKADIKALGRLFKLSEMVKQVNDLKKACAGADMLICSAEAYFGRIVHELLNIPYVSVHLDHFNKEYNNESLDIISSLESKMVLYINALRRKFGLKKITNPLQLDGVSSQLSLFGVSKMMLDSKAEKEWPDHYHTTGFFFLDQKNISVEQGLIDFLKAGDPPILFTFGSMVYENREEMAEIIFETIENLGYRSLVQKGWGNLSAGQQNNPNLYFIDFIPYSWLFSKVSCVIQSGGAGTTAWAIRCGIPTVCVPHIFQQFSFTKFAEVIGVAGPVIDYKELNSKNLTASIKETVTNPAYGLAARKYGKIIRQEGGAETAVKLIEELYEKIREADNSATKE